MPIGRIERPETLDPSLSAEAEQVVQEASGAMMKWIDGAVDKLARDMEKGLDDAARKLEEQAAVMEKDYAEAGDRLVELAASISNLKTSLDSEASKNAFAKAQEKIGEVRSLLKSREERWKGAGRDTIRVAVAAAKKAIVG